MAAEAIDEKEVDVYESWEDMDENGLDRLSLLPPPARSSLCTVNILADDSSTLGGAYMMPEPTIRILKRPERRDEAAGVADSARRPVRTLEQRKKDYEEARLRILGEARSPEDVIDDKLNRLQEKLQTSTISQPVRVKERPSSSGVPGAPNGATRGGVSILRAPRTPDGTRGFNR